LAEKARKLSRGRAENEISFSLVLSGTVICALELLRLGAREGSKKENSGKTCEQREKLSRDQIETKREVLLLEVSLLEIKRTEDRDSLLYARDQICWLRAKSEHCNHKN
jgi:hypothetical protein